MVAQRGAKTVPRLVDCLGEVRVRVAWEKRKVVSTICLVWTGPECWKMQVVKAVRSVRRMQVYTVTGRMFGGADHSASAKYP